MRITDMMMGGDGNTVVGDMTELHLSAVSEAMNQMMGSAATALAKLLNRSIDISPPKTEQIDDMYADFLVKHANELDPYLILIKPSEIRGDEEYVCKVLRMIVNQSIKLDKEIEIPSRKYVVEL